MEDWWTTVLVEDIRTLIWSELDPLTLYLFSITNKTNWSAGQSRLRRAVPRKSELSLIFLESVRDVGLMRCLLNTIPCLNFKWESRRDPCLEHLMRRDPLLEHLVRNPSLPCVEHALGLIAKNVNLADFVDKWLCSNNVDWADFVGRWMRTTGSFREDVLIQIMRQQNKWVSDWVKMMLIDHGASPIILGLFNVVTPLQ